MTLSKETIAGAKDLTFKDVKVPEWDGSVRVRVLTAKEEDDYEESIITMEESEGVRHITPNLTNAKAKLIARCLVDENGDPIFATVAEGEKVLGGKSASAINRIYRVAVKLNGLSKQDIEELVKNSETALPEDSPSD